MSDAGGGAVGQEEDSTVQHRCHITQHMCPKTCTANTQRDTYMHTKTSNSQKQITLVFIYISHQEGIIVLKNRIALSRLF